MFLRWAAPCAALILSGCASGNTQAVVAFAPQAAQSISVKDVEVKVATADAPPELGEIVRKHLLKELATCATGKTPVNVQAAISAYEGPNAAKAILIGHSVRLHGSVKFLSDIGTTLGDYDVDRTLSGGGLLAAGVMSGQPDNISSLYAKEVCTTIFGYKYPSR
jgi:hypothetical protein